MSQQISADQKRMPDALDLDLKATVGCVAWALESQLNPLQ